MKWQNFDTEAEISGIVEVSRCEVHVELSDTEVTIIHKAQKPILPILLAW